MSTQPADVQAAVSLLWGALPVYLPESGLDDDDYLHLTQAHIKSDLSKLKVFNTIVPDPPSNLGVTGLSRCAIDHELRWPMKQVEDLLQQVAAHIVYEYYSQLSWKQAPMRQLVTALLQRPDNQCGVLMRHVVGSLYSGCSLKLLLVPQLDANNKPLLHGFFFPVHAQQLKSLMPEHLIKYHQKQDKLRAHAGILEWEQHWRKHKLKPSSGIAAADPKVTSKVHMYAVPPVPLQYVTTNIVDGQPESLGLSEEQFCAACDCTDFSALGCGGAEGRRAIWKMRESGVPYKLEIRDAGQCGLGVYALEDIPGHTAVLEYVGEFLSKQEEKARQAEYYSDDKGWHYLMTVFHTHKAESARDCKRQLELQQQERKAADKEVCCVDATRIGNVGHFINHCCSPNCVLRAVCRGPHTADTSMINVLYTGPQGIKAGEQLTFDYNPNQKADVPEKDIAIHCYCGASNCRGFVLATISRARKAPVCTVVQRQQRASVKRQDSGQASSQPGQRKQQRPLRQKLQQQQQEEEQEDDFAEERDSSSGGQTVQQRTRGSAASRSLQRTRTRQ